MCCNGWLDFDRWFLRQAFAADNPERVREVDRLCEAQNVVNALAEASRRTGNSLLATHARLNTSGAVEFRMWIRDGDAFGHASVVQGLVGRGTRAWH